MRINERIARLEKAKSSAGRMTAAEIDEAAARFDRELLGEPAGIVSLSLPGWRSTIEAARPSWLQRTLAAMSPVDWSL